jgi:hypothetical protein
MKHSVITDTRRKEVLSALSEIDFPYDEPTLNKIFNDVGYYDTINPSGNISDFLIRVVGRRYIPVQSVSYKQ